MIVLDHADRLLGIARFIVLATVLIAPEVVASDNALITVQGAKVFVPAPATMRSVSVSDFSARHPDFLVPEKTRVLAIFIPAKDKLTDNPDYFAFVQINEPPLRVQRSGVAMLKEAMAKKPLDRLPEAITSTNRAFSGSKKKIAAYYRTPGATITAKNMTMHKLVIDYPDLFGYSMYGEYEFAMDGQKADLFRPSVMMFGTVKETGLYLYYIGAFDSSADDPKFLAAARKWAKEFLEANAIPVR